MGELDILRCIVMLIEILTTILIFVTVLMTVCIFLQKPEGNSFMSGATDTLSNILSAQSSRNPIARLTAILAGIFFVLCLTIAVLTGTTRNDSVIDTLAQEGTVRPTQSSPAKEEAPEKATTEQPSSDQK